jgi:hypothetical protein
VRRLLRTSALATVCLAAALVAPAGAAAASWDDDPHFVASHVPRGFHPHEVWDYRGLASIWYAQRRHPLGTITVHTHTDGRCCYDSTTDQRPIRIRGRRATIARLVDGEAVYGRTIYWEERPGMFVEVVDQAGIRRRTLERIARGVRLAGDGEWRRLLIATTVVPSEDQLRARPRRVVDRGVIAGRVWTFSALLPRGYPLFSWDRRVPCPELRFGGVVHLDRWDCEGFPVFWRLIGNEIFVYGALGNRDIERVRVRDYYDNDDPGVVVKVRSAMPGFKFYVAPMPRDTCEVMVVDADKRRSFAEPGGPFGSSNPEVQRCARQRSARS